MRLPTQANCQRPMIFWCGRSTAIRADNPRPRWHCPSLQKCLPTSRNEAGDCAKWLQTTVRLPLSRLDLWHRRKPHHRTAFRGGISYLNRADTTLMQFAAVEGAGLIWMRHLLRPDEKTFALIWHPYWRSSRDSTWPACSAAETTLDVRANWKLLVEGGLEAYHFKVAHRNTIGPYFSDNQSTTRHWDLISVSPVA